MSMIVVSIVLSRLAPLLVWVSLFLVAGRFLFEKLRDRHFWGSRLVFGGTLLLGAALAAPYGLQTYFLVSAESAFAGTRWEDAASSFETYFVMDGRFSEERELRWGLALMNQGSFQAAADVLAGQRTRGTADPRRGGALATDRFLSVGICHYYLGNLELASTLLSSAPAGVRGMAYLTAYFLGRTLEKRGGIERAISSYERALQDAPGFTPALYHLARLRLGRGEGQRLLRTIEEQERILESRPTDANSVLVRRAAAESRADLLPDKEFLIVPH
jgi:tetratricopeptide (TPR) repeat protein